jgi:hypothetical protein
MKNIIKNRFYFALILLPIIGIMIYIEDKNISNIEFVLYVLFYLLVIYRLFLVNFNRKLLYTFIVLLTLPLVFAAIGYLFNLEGYISNFDSKFSLIFIIVIAIAISIFFLYMTLEALLRKYNAPKTTHVDE